MPAERGVCSQQAKRIFDRKENGLRRIALLVLASFTLWQTALAVPIQGTASGVFTGGPGDHPGLGYAGNSFGYPNPLNLTQNPLILNLGTFSLNNQPGGGILDTFTLTVNFTQPPGYANDFTATVVGNVVQNASGVVFIDFNNTPFHFVDNSLNYWLTVGDLTITTNELSKVVEGSLSVPEPAAFEALGAGLIGVVLLLRRRSLTLGGLLAR